MSEQCLNGKVVIVIGGGFGIGQVIVICFVEYGVKVYMLDCMLEKVEEMKQMIEKVGGEVYVIECDIFKLDYV